PLRPIGVHEGDLLYLQPTLDELAQIRRTDLAILRRRLYEAEEDLVAGDRHADRRDHLVLGEGLAVEQQRDQIVAVQPPFHQLAQLARAGTFEAARHRR